MTFIAALRCDRIEAPFVFDQPINSTSFGQITSLASGLNTGGNGGMRSFIINSRLNF